jgi:hypothetical protein
MPVTRAVLVAAIRDAVLGLIHALLAKANEKVNNNWSEIWQ